MTDERKLEKKEPAREETGTARRAEEQATRRSEPNHLGEAEHAFEQSRGEDRRRHRD